MIVNIPEIDSSVKFNAIDIKTRNDLVLKNIRLAYYFVSKYRNRGIPFHELLSAGYLGLINAAMNYSPERGSFGVCAGIYIKQTIFKEFRSNRLIMFPPNRTQHFITVRKTREKLEQKLKREPFPEEIAEAAGLTINDVKTVIENEALPVSIFQKDEEDERPFIDVLQDGDIKSDPELQPFELQGRLQRLSSKERSILHSYLWEEKTLEEIAQKLGSNRETVRLLIKEAIKKLKKINLFSIKLRCGNQINQLFKAGRKV